MKYADESSTTDTPSLVDVLAPEEIRPATSERSPLPWYIEITYTLAGIAEDQLGDVFERFADGAMDRPGPDDDQRLIDPTASASGAERRFSIDMAADIPDLTEAHNAALALANRAIDAAGLRADVRKIDTATWISGRLDEPVPLD